MHTVLEIILFLTELLKEHFNAVAHNLKMKALSLVQGRRFCKTGFVSDRQQVSLPSEFQPFCDHLSVIAAH